MFPSELERLPDTKVNVSVTFFGAARMCFTHNIVVAHLAKRFFPNAYKIIISKTTNVLYELALIFCPLIARPTML
jgi:hypothetical protein